MAAPVLPVAILAGGLATRLRPITTVVPKALVEVAGEPFIRHQLRQLRDSGVTRVVVCVGHLGQMVEETLAAYGDLDMDVQVRFDGPRLLGTAGALRAAAALLDEAFFVLYGDSYLTCDFSRVQAAFETSQQLALMTVFRNEGQWDQSNVEFQAGRIIAYDKRTRSARMQHIDYGLGILSRAALDEVPADTAYDLAVLYADLLRRGQLAGYEVSERFYEIGSPDGLTETRQYLQSRLAASRGSQ
jgi:N-acetyl-alpha-D-muramate 1-phosphate uridylyltransferase